MDRISELRKRERRLRDRLRQAPVGEFGVSPEGRSWILHHVSEMRMILERYLAEIPSSERQYEEYRLELELPIFNHLSRAYELFYPRVPCSSRSVIVGTSVIAGGPKY